MSSWTGSRKAVMINSATWGNGVRQGVGVTGNVPTSTDLTATHSPHSKDDNPLRQLEDYCGKIRENPKTDVKSVPKPIVRKDDPLRPSTTNRPNRQSDTLAEVRRLDRDATTKRQLKEEAKKESENMRRIQVSEWTQTADRHIRRLKRENEALTKIATLTQQNALDNDARYEEALAGLKAQVEYTTTYRGENTEATRYMRESMNAIQDRIQQMRSAAERLKETELHNLRNAFDEQVDSWTKKLEDAKSDGEATTQKWVEQNMALRKQLDDTLAKADTAYHGYKKLQAAHRRLLIENQAQSDDAALLAKQWTLVSAQHRRLKDRAQDLEAELAVLNGESRPKPVAEGEDFSDILANEDKQRAPSREDKETRRAQHEHALRRATELLQVEAQNLQIARHSHVQALKQRTELEVYLRQTIVKHQNRLAEEHYAKRQGLKADSRGLPNLRGQSAPPTRPTTSSAAKLQKQADESANLSYTSFAADDRRLVMEVMLSLPRVVQLLFGTAGVPTHFVGENTDEELQNEAGVSVQDLRLLGVEPPAYPDAETVEQEDGDHSDPSLEREDGAASQQQVENDMNALWTKWQRWSKSADRNLDLQQLRHQRDQRHVTATDNSDYL